MVEAKRSASIYSMSTTLSRTGRSTQPRILVQPVSLDTPVPPLPKPEALLSSPDSRDYEKNMRKINSTLRRLLRQLVSRKYITLIERV